MIYRTSWQDQETRHLLTPTGWTYTEGTAGPLDDLYVDVRPDERLYPTGVSLRFETGSQSGFHRCIWTDGDIAADQRVLALVETSKLLTNGVFTYVLARYTDADNNIRAYLIDNNSFRVGEWVEGVFASLGTVTFNWSVNTKYWILLECVGTSIRAKVWANGDAEPASWMIDNTSSENPDGRQGVGVFNGVGFSPGTLFHEFRVATDADEMPRGYGSPRRPVVLSASEGELVVKPFNLAVLQTASGTAPCPNDRTVAAWRARAGTELSEWVTTEPFNLTIENLLPDSTHQLQIQLRDSEDEESDWSGPFVFVMPSDERTITGLDFTRYADDTALQTDWPKEWENASQVASVHVSDITYRSLALRCATNGLALFRWESMIGEAPFKVKMLLNRKVGSVKAWGIPLNTVNQAGPYQFIEYQRNPGVVRVRQVLGAVVTTQDTEPIYTDLSIQHGLHYVYLEAELTSAGQVRGRMYYPWQSPPSWQVEFAAQAGVDLSAVMAGIFVIDSFADDHVMSVEFEHSIQIPLGLITTNGEEDGCPSESQGWSGHRSLPGLDSNNLLGVDYDQASGLFIVAGVGGLSRSADGGVTFDTPIDPGWGLYPSTDPIQPLGGISHNLTQWLVLDAYGGWSISSDEGFTWAAMQWPGDGGEGGSLDTILAPIEAGPSGLWAYAADGSVRRITGGLSTISRDTFGIDDPTALIRAIEGVWVVGSNGVQRCVSDTLDPGGWESTARTVVSGAFEADVYETTGPSTSPLSILRFAFTTASDGVGGRLWAFGNGPFLVYSDDFGVTWSKSLSDHALGDAGASMHPLLNWRGTQRETPVPGFGSSQIYGIVQSPRNPGRITATARWNVVLSEQTVSRIAYSCSTDFGETWTQARLLPGLPNTRAALRGSGPIFIRESM